MRFNSAFKGLNGNSNKTLRSQHMHIRNNFVFSRAGYHTGK